MTNHENGVRRKFCQRREEFAHEPDIAGTELGAVGHVNRRGHGGADDDDVRAAGVVHGASIDARGDFDEGLRVAEVERIADGGLAVGADEDHFADEVALGQGKGERGTNPPKPDDRNFHVQKIICAQADGKFKSGGVKSRCILKPKLGSLSPPKRGEGWGEGI